MPQKPHFLAKNGASWAHFGWKNMPEEAQKSIYFLEKISAE